MKRDVFDVHVIWKGPYRHDKLVDLRNEDSDYGVYLAVAPDSRPQRSRVNATLGVSKYRA